MPANLSQLTEYGETPRHCSLCVSSHARVGVDVNAKVTNWRHRVNHNASTDSADAGIMCWRQLVADHMTSVFAGCLSVCLIFERCVKMMIATATIDSLFYLVLEKVSLVNALAPNSLKFGADKTHNYSKELRMLTPSHVISLTKDRDGWRKFARSNGRN